MELALLTLAAVGLAAVALTLLRTALAPEEGVIGHRSSPRRDR